ncbi:MAG: polysaccharide pyruvyl transferase family protein [Spirulina sp.]
MKIFHYQRPDGLENFGDRLNQWLWPQLLPGIFDEDETTAFVGIGTLLNNLLPQRLPEAKTVVIFSAGAGYEKKLTAIPPHWHIYCLRGFLSARQLGLSEELVVMDGAVLVKRLFQPTGEKVSRFAFMPHIHHAKFAGDLWQEICQDIGFEYIDPCWSVEAVLAAIAKTEVILAEAMHGAIVADALGIPWIPIVTSPRILAFKWDDWCSSLGLAYRPHFIPPVLYPRFARGVRSSLSGIQHWGNYFRQEKNGLGRDRWHWCRMRLQHIAEIARPCSSDRDRLEALTVELESRLERFRRDFEGRSWE